MYMYKIGFVQGGEKRQDCKNTRSHTGVGSYHSTFNPLPQSSSYDSRDLSKRAAMPKVYLLDYVAGNIRSLVNAIEKVGYTVEWVRSPEDVAKADVSNICQF